MINGNLPRVILGLVIILYPIVVYLGLRSVEPRIVAFLLLLLGGFRLILGKVDRRTSMYWAFALLLATGLTFVTGSQYGLLAYPLLVNVAFLSLFVVSLFNPPSAIEKIARLREPELPPKAIEYTRKVTMVWCGFFIVNGTISFFTIFASKDVWVLYNGLISYILMGLLFSGEYWVRRKQMRLNHD